MSEEDTCVGGDGGPLVLLQAAAGTQWQGANDFDNSLMNGGTVETDYDIICSGQNAQAVCVLRRYGRDMLVLWDSEEGASVLAPFLAGLAPDTLLLTRCFDPADLPYTLSDIAACVREGRPQRSLVLNIQDTTLRLQVGADSPTPSFSYKHVDIPIAAGMKRCDVYLVVSDTFSHEVVVVTAQESLAS